MSSFQIHALRNLSAPKRLSYEYICRRCGNDFTYQGRRKRIYCNDCEYYFKMEGK